MKRTISFIIIIIILFANCACSTRSLNSTKSAMIPTAVPQPTENPNPWKISNLVDEFGDPTREKYAKYFFTGTFSNTVTASSPLSGYVLCEPWVWSGSGKFVFVFRLFEYGNIPATFFKSDKPYLSIKIDGKTFVDNKGGAVKYNLDIEDDGDLELDTTLFEWRDGSPIFFESYDFEQALENGKTIKCIIGNGRSKYWFTISGTGFADTKHRLGANSNP